MEEERSQEPQEFDPKRALLSAMSKVADHQLTDLTTVHITLPSEDYKGRLIGREGRNIRLFEHLTGVDLIIDETPETVSLSSFSPFDREVARIALINLIVDGRIHPTRIEEIVTEARRNIDDYLTHTVGNALHQLSGEAVSPDCHSRLRRAILERNNGRSEFELAIQTAELAAHLASEIGYTPTNIPKIALEHYFAMPSAAHLSTEAEIASLAKKVVLNRPGAIKADLDAFLDRINLLESRISESAAASKVIATKSGNTLQIFVNVRGNNGTDATITGSVTKAVHSVFGSQTRFNLTIVRETTITANSNE